MATFMRDLVGNRIFMSAIAGWAVAQLLKTIIYFIINKKFRAERLVGSGGMPSSHSATVCALTTASAFEYGAGSPIFAVSLILAIIVMHDARGVRLETGNQAKLINSFVKIFKDMGREEVSTVETLEEFIGHTPIQVIVGAILGILTAWLLHFV